MLPSVCIEQFSRTLLWIISWDSEHLRWSSSAWIRSRADCSIESKLYLTSVHALVPELPLISSCIVQHQISDLFVVTLEMRYLMTQGTFGARISGAVDHMHPAWSTANKIRPWYVPWIMSYNLCSINVWPRALRCRKFILYLLLPLLLLPAATGSCHYLFLLLPAVPIE